MTTSHRKRLPVSKPRFDHPTKIGLDNSTTRPLPSAGEFGGSLNPPSPAQSASPPNRSESTDSIPSGSSVEIPLAIPSAKSVVFDRVEIEVEPDESRPFELGDLLTREFAARNSSFLISLAFHTLTLLLLSLVLIHSTGKALIMLELLSSPDIEEYAGIIAEVDVDINDLDELVAAVDEDPFNAAFGDSDGDEQVAEAGQNPAQEGSGEQTHAKGDGKSAKFFGMRAIGNKFVYVLDRSGSMAYESSDVTEYKVSRFDVARLELIKSVESLRPHQEFYVVLFSTGMEQMFNKDALIPSAVKATPENKERLKTWLWKNRANGGTDPRKSLKLAFKMNPDSIFMLSDGEFRDEKNDGNPRTIDITRKQIEENSAIPVNSIALEDDTSKKNMEELSAVSGGQFRFVKVKDYISRMAISPAEFFRSRVPSQSHLQVVVTWNDRDTLAKKLIPLLESGTQSDRRDAENRLHELSFGVFESAIPSVASADVEQETIATAIDAWTDAWAIANDQTNLDPSTPIGLFSTLVTVGNKDFLESVESLNVTSLSPLDQIVVAQSILQFQDRNGLVNSQTKTLLMNYLRELNKESQAEFDEDRFLKRATQTTCEGRLKTVLKNRRLRASRLSALTQDKRLLEQVRIEHAKDLIALYPETKAARQIAEELKIPVSHTNLTD